MHANYPTGPDVKVFLTEAGFTVHALSVLESYAQMGADQWEEESGWYPFKAEAEDSTRVFSPSSVQNNELDLQGGLIAAPTSVTVNGTAWEEGTQYIMLPENAPAKGKPYTAIRFRYRPYGLPNTLLVTGLWGYMSPLTENVWYAVLCLAGLKLLPKITANITRGATEVKQGPVEYKFDRQALAKEAEMWQSEVDQALTTYKRRSIG